MNIQVGQEVTVFSPDMSIRPITATVTSIEHISVGVIKVVLSPGAEPIAATLNFSLKHPEGERLIAVATELHQLRTSPDADLLAACKALLARMRAKELSGPTAYDRNAVQMAIAAIAKAEGSGT